VTGITHWKCS